MAPHYAGTLRQLPLIPQAVLRQHRVDEPADADSRFRAAARLLQALWREDRSLPIGFHKSSDGTRRRLGSRISPAAARAGANFLSPDIAHVARREFIYREPGAFIDEDRLFTNLLSSMPLTFNLFGPLRLDLMLATRFVQHLFPELADARVHGVLFEHAPGRGDSRLTGDYSAFDTVIAYDRPNGSRGFIGIEVKYTETMQEPVPAIRPRVEELIRTSELFIDPDGPALRQNPLQQCVREHVLAQAMLDQGLYQEGRFVVIAPALNHLVQNAVGAYRCQLNEPHPDRAGFASFTLEQCVAAVAHAGQPEYARALHRRYTDFMLVDGEIELHLSALSRQRRKLKPKPALPQTQVNLLTAPSA